MSGSSKQPSNTTQTVNTTATPWSGVQDYLLQMYPYVGQMMNTPAEFYPGQTYAPMSEYTQQGLDSMMGFVDNVFPQAYDTGLQSLYDLQNYVDVANNPYVQGMNQQLGNEVMASGRQQIGDYANTMNNQLASGMFNLNQGLQNQATAYNSMLGDTTKNYLQNVLPGITQDAVYTNTLGGTRNALAQIGATDAFGQQLEQAMSNMSMNQADNYNQLNWNMGNTYQNASNQLQNAISNNQMALSRGIADTNLGAYNTGVNAQIQALQMMPQYMELGTMPGQIYQQAGNVYEGYQQKAIDEEMARWDFAQNEPWQRLANASSIFAGAAPYASGSSTGVTSNPKSASNPWATGAGLALGAYGLMRG